MFATPLPPRRARPWLRPVLLIVAAAALASPAAAQWKWRDAQGRVQYSDRPPPPDVRDKDILSRPAGTAAPASPVMQVPGATAAQRSGAPAASASAASAPTSDPALEARKRMVEASKEQAKRDEEEKIARQKIDNCNRAKEYARTLESGVRVSRTNDKGEREIIDDAQRARDTARAREVIASDCR